MASASVTGVSDLTLNVTPLSVEINRGATDKTLVDYSRTDPANASSARKTATVINPGPSDTLELTLAAAEGELTRVKGNVKIDLFGFVQAEGSFGIEKKSGQIKVGALASTPALNESTNPIDVEMLLIGGTGLSGFAGINGGRSDATGLTL